MGKGRMRITGWVIGGTTLPVLADNDRIVATDFLWLGVDLFATLAKQELRLPASTVLVAAERGAFNTSDQRLIETGQWVTYAGEWAAFRVVAPGADDHAAIRQAVRMRRSVLAPAQTWLARHAAVIQKTAAAGTFKRLEQGYLAGTFDFATLQQRQAALVHRAWYPLARDFARLQRDQTRLALQTAEQLEAVAPTTYAFTRISGATIVAAAPVIMASIPQVDRLQLNSECYRHDLVVELRRQQQARLTSGKPLFTDTTRPFTGGAVWQSDGTLAPRNQEGS